MRKKEREAPETVTENQWTPINYQTALTTLLTTTVQLLEVFFSLIYQPKI